MKSSSVFFRALAVLVGISMAAPVFADSSEETRNLFESAGEKQTNRDFKPAPDTIETNFGTLKFGCRAPSHNLLRCILSLRMVRDSAG